MNKKGYLSSIIFGMIGLFVLLFVAVALAGIQEGAEASKTIDLLNKVQGDVSLRFTPNQQSHIAVRVTYSFMNFITYSSIELAKSAVEYGVANPEWINPKMLIIFIMLSLLAPVIIVLFKLGIIIFLLIREHIQSRKEKRILKQ